MAWRSGWKTWAFGGEDHAVPCFASGSDFHLKNKKKMAPEVRSARNPRTVAVIGAGAFGGWTALHLLRKGCRVQLFDAWGAGNSRSSSGGETRIIRAVYGADAIYSRLVARSFELWEAFDRRSETRVLVRAPKLFMVSGDDDSYPRLALEAVREAGLEFYEYPLEEARKAYPQINFEDVHQTFLEPRAGYLSARLACREVCRVFVEEGGYYQQLNVLPGAWEGGRLANIRTSDGTTVEADAYVFACGPWLPQVFPSVLRPHLTLSRQEVYYFGAPAGNPHFSAGRLPIWLDLGDPIYYGIPSGDHRGFKIADDTRREPIDPTTLERTPLPDRVEAARQYLSRRFPALAGAPLIEARVCQYTNSPDGDFLLDRHPEADNVWLAGAGCGHAFKMGPAIGEYLAGQVLGQGQPEARFRWERFTQPSPVKTQFE